MRSFPLHYKCYTPDRPEQSAVGTASAFQRASCMGTLSTLTVCVSVCGCGFERTPEKQKKKKGRERQSGSQAQAYPRGLKPKPLDISDLEGKWVKNKQEPGKRGRKIKRWKEREGKAQSFQRAAGKPPESSAQTNHKIPAEATKPGRGLTRVPPARRGCVCSQDYGVRVHI